MESSNPSGSGGGDHNIFLYNMGKDTLEQARVLEANGKIEPAYKLYKEAANKFLYVIRNGESEMAKGPEIRLLAQKAIDSGVWVKQQIEDQKSKLVKPVAKSSN